MDTMDCAVPAVSLPAVHRDADEEVRRLRGYLVQIRAAVARLGIPLVDDSQAGLRAKLNTIGLIARAALEGQCSRCDQYGPTRAVEFDEQDIVELCLNCER